MRRFGDWSAPILALVVLVVAAVASLAFARGLPGNIILSFGMLIVAIVALISFTAVTSLDPANREAHDHDH